MQGECVTPTALLRSNRSGLLELESVQPYRTLIYAIYLWCARTTSKVVACRGRLPAIWTRRQQ